MNDNTYIISAKGIENTCILSKVCLIVYLYYPDVYPYCRYLKDIPHDIHIYVFSSKEDVLEKCKRILVNKENIHYELKLNRGRDISTLLVAANDIINHYDIFAFLHDKTANRDYLVNDVEIWKKNLWDNMIHNHQYIYQVLKVFENYPKCGILGPPEAIGEFHSFYYGDTWFENYDNTKALAKKIGIDAETIDDIMPTILGSVFWARTKSLKKLFDYDWKYSDFPDEPLPMDGTISHAIERIFEYVAIDAGYYAGTIMTEQYATWLVKYTQIYMRKMFSYIQKKHFVFNMHQVGNLENRENKIKKLAKDKNKIYIYGAGNYGKNMRKFLESLGITVSGYIVSDGKRKVSKLDDIDVYELSEVQDIENVGIIVSVSYEYRNEIEELLIENDIADYVYGY